ncbi:anchored repeat-type ABC transporter ATP-binding subunit [Streptomyces sp. YIM 98790]|uniref:anchored repeat-type ABC transporter ATP-binding subunit n=1 Tax=Streptomyces sp. YIM 98790 TaxID=2689077 RepID=UPI00140DE86A|nr:anchored repeat-type ABC transporter ATP-binding subunit [Streptomyces sp. YIM 98790]
MTTGEPLLTVDAATVLLGGREVLRDASLTLHGGELVGLIGPNGAGKTTLLRAVLGLVPLAGGEVRIAGLPVGRARHLIGYVPQRHEFAWDFPIDIAGAVLAARTRSAGWLRPARAADRAAAEQAIERVGLTDLRGRPVGELSGGQRQRVLVARALATGPRLLLLDEPFTGVDTPTQETLGELLAELRDAGTGLLMATHDLPTAAKTCDRVALVDGTVVAEGGPELLTETGSLLRAFGLTATGTAS